MREIELVIIEAAIFIVGLIGNIFVLIIVHKANGKKKTFHGIFVTSLAIADLVLLCFDSPVTILGRLGIKPHTFNCRVHLTAVTTGYNAGLFTITSMATHRCHVVTHPWRPKLKRRAAIIWVSLIWLTAFVLVIPLMVVNKPTGASCREVWPSMLHRQAYTASLTTLQYVLPLIITVVCYLRIWLFLRRRPVMPRSSVTNESLTPEEESTRESSVILKTVAVVVLLFLFLLLPTQVAWMLLDFRHVSYEELWFASDILTRLHSCLNPVVYGVMNKQYRRSYMKLLSCMFCCSRFSNFSPSLHLVQPQTSHRNYMTNEVEDIQVVRVSRTSENTQKTDTTVALDERLNINL